MSLTECFWLSINVDSIGGAERDNIMPMIYVTLCGPQVAASESTETQERIVREMVQSIISGHVRKAYDHGEDRKTVSIRTVFLPLEK